jgi:orotidine-5'-phosphate decarboxylase
MLNNRWSEGRFLGVGLDSELRRIIQIAEGDNGQVDVCNTMVGFNTKIIWETHDLAAVYLFNHNFYLAQGVPGFRAMEETVARIHSIAPKVPIVLNTCEGDIGNSNLAFLEYALRVLGVDGFTINPLFGQEALQPFLDLRHKGIIVACRTSNYKADEFQCLPIQDHENVPFYKSVAHRVSMFWNEKRNCALQFGVRCADSIRLVRQDVAPDLPIFVQGIGPQSKTGEIEEDDVRGIVVASGNSEGTGFVLCSARGIIFSPQPRQEATRLHHLIEKYRNELAMKAG